MLVKLISSVSFLSAILLLLVAPEYQVFISTLIAISFLAFLFHIRKKPLRKISNEILTIVLTFCLVGIINWIVLKKDKSFDWTPYEFHTLTDQTQTILKKLSEPLEMTLVSKRSNWKTGLDFLNMYKEQSSKVVIKAIDPLESPLELQQLGVDVKEGLHLSFAGKTMTLDKLDEQRLINAIYKLQGQRKKDICFLKGHNELSLKNDKNDGLSYLYGLLLSENFNVLELSIQSEKISRCQLIVSINPRNDFLALETKLLNDFLIEGKNLFMSFSPDFSFSKTPALDQFLNEHGVKKINSVVIDRLSQTQKIDPTTIIIEQVASSPSNLINGRIIYPMSLAFQAVSNKSYFPLFRSKAFPATWAETNLDLLKHGKASYEDKSDLKGPLDLAVATTEGQKGNLTVFGSSRFLINAYQSQVQNFNYILNLFHFYTQNEGKIVLNRPKLQTIKLAIPQVALNTIFFISVILLPFVFFGLSFYLFQRRKSL